MEIKIVLMEKMIPVMLNFVRFVIIFSSIEKE